MRTKQLLIFLAATIAGGIILTTSLTTTYERSYVPREAVQELYSSSGYVEWLHNVKANQHTKSIEPEHLQKAEAGLKLMESKLDFHQDYNWAEKGPNNIGGRTRSILIDKENTNIIWAGAVAGGIWKSETSGQYWMKVDYSVPSGFTPHSVTSITQGADGTIYFGTGEAFSNFVGNNQATPMIMGGGIFKQDGETFTRFSATAPQNSSDFYGVRRIAAHPTDNGTILAATLTGIFETTDGGETWVKAINVEGSAWDVAYGSDGTALACVGHKTYRRASGASSFVAVSGLKVDNKVPEMRGRYVIDFLVSNPKYVFVSIADSTGQLEGVYRSSNYGVDWDQVGYGGSTEFKPFGANKQGIYDHALKAITPDHVLLGGIDMYAGIGAPGQSVFEWNKISYWSFPETDPLYIHADIHTFDFYGQGSNITLYIGTDGGIFRRSPTGNRALNTYYNVTQFYRADINSEGHIVGGTQDNGTLLMNYTLPGSQQQNAVKVYGGDGMDCAFSKISPEVFTFESQYGNMQKSNTYGVDYQHFWSSFMMSKQSWSSDNDAWAAGNASWLAPMATWETDDYRYIRHDTSRVVTIRDYDDSTWYRVESANISGQYLNWYSGDTKYEAGDEIAYADPFQATMLFGMSDRIWFTRKVFNFQSPMLRFEWSDIFNKILYEKLPTSTTATRFVAVEFSSDGDIAYGATEPDHEGKACIYRIANLHACTEPGHLSFQAFDNNVSDTSDRLTQIKTLGKISGRYITDLAVDPHNPEALIVTMGQYGNDDFVYVAANAATTASTDFNVNFVPIQGNLPPMPVYTACVNSNPNNPNQLLVGTDNGVFVTDNYLGANVVWTEGNQGLGHYPVFDIRQYRRPTRLSGAYTMGDFVIATHGRGVFVDTAHRYTIVGIDNPDYPNGITTSSTLGVKVYPNPAQEVAYVNVVVTERTTVDIRIFDLTGKLVYSTTTGRVEAGSHVVTIPVDEFLIGTYIVHCTDGSKTQSTRLLKQ
ncbi:MAG: T9SS type A sorting domain-containing protein [Salinivirgaceae bacterium]|nr:T9SS type A sorting domain-containing protein [Salinivirgaceae bacterium]